MKRQTFPENACYKKFTRIKRNWVELSKGLLNPSALGNDSVKEIYNYCLKMQDILYKSWDAENYN